MKTYLKLLLNVVFFSLQLISAAWSAQETAPAFTNEDIEKYRNPSDNSRRETARDSSYEKKREYSLSRDRQEQESWCNKATAINRKIEKAERSVKEIEDDIEQAKNSQAASRNNLLRKKLKKAKERLSDEQRDLNDLENRAHRKGVPPGWLRCQFE